jgi:PBP1b-binding outer membrane lipoprotein LpoB
LIKINKMKRIILSTVVLSLVFASCSDNKNKSETEGAKEVVELQDAETVAVDASTSTLTWEGSSPKDTHTGNITIKEGFFKVSDNQLQAGSSFTLDMASLTVTDLTAEQGKIKLEQHLAGTKEDGEGKDDFFNVTEFPEASLMITSVNENKIEGNLTIKGQEKNISFLGEFSATDGSYNLKSSEPIILDRTEWGISFMSKSLGDQIKDKFIEDKISIEFDVKS